MRLRIALLLLFVLLLAGLGLWGGQGLAAGPSAPAYLLEQPVWEVSGQLAGGDYRLAPPGKIEGNGTPCCCLHLPCVRKK